MTATVPEGAEPAEDLTVTIAHSGSAAWDPLGFGDYGLGTLIVEAGQRSGTATLRANDDNIYEQTRPSSWWPVPAGIRAVTC